ncbi:hypothetical protein [Coxiella burnetii]|uniref:hypothetical protein n=1 Tax=Coxiella burnetii TaxID=777 RepID=UPI000FF896BB|nr:hypothetical protein [Coxiella burnetii]MCF2094091.1 hypothetical protein [Coxiella burnetii]MCF2096040.1 hypothetical protein [Coxiella burnetii]MCF2098102.1 hypothetical protein [Coxiella burnetii]MCF2100142.1 hypothetical protein [Coxiella burnetii]MCF2102276.1 hypothetical protein [Coxiella burnetii]
MGQCTKQGSSNTSRLTTTNQQGSVLSVSEGNHAPQDCIYTPYGYRTPQTETPSVLGFNGSGWTRLVVPIIWAMATAPTIRY